MWTQMVLCQVINADVIIRAACMVCARPVCVCVFDAVAWFASYLVYFQVFLLS